MILRGAEVGLHAFTITNPVLANSAYLGVDTASGSNATIIFKDFQWGTSYTPVLRYILPLYALSVFSG
jgi:hypothetical protein